MRNSSILCVAAWIVACGGVGRCAETGGIRGVVNAPTSARGRELVVYVAGVRGRWAPAAEPVVDQKNREFVPRVLPILQGSTVRILNSESFTHNVQIFHKGKLLMDASQPAGGPPLRRKFDDPGVVVLLCGLHLEMKAYLLVLENPYFAKVRAGEPFEIRGVPAGRHRLKVWGEALPRERLAQSVSVEVKPGAVSEVALSP